MKTNEHIILEIDKDIEYNLDINNSYIVNVNSGVSPIINIDGKITSVDNSIVININNDSKVTIYNYVMVNEQLNLVIDTNINGNNNVVNLYGKYCCLDNSNVSVISNGNVLKDTLDNEFNEHFKALVFESSKAKILPNLLVNTNNIIANHGVSISGVDKDYLFYLNSHGISNEEGIQLLKSSFLNK